LEYCKQLKAWQGPWNEAKCKLWQCIFFPDLVFFSPLTHLQAWTFWITLDPVHEFHLYSWLGCNCKISGQVAEAIRAFEHAAEISHSCSEQRWKQSTKPEAVEIDLGILYR